MSPNGKNPAIRHNYQPREENVYLVPENELDLLGSTDLRASFLMTISMGFLGLIISMTTTGREWPWSVGFWTTLGFLAGVTLILAIWCGYELKRRKDIVGKIKKLPKPVRNGNGDTGITPPAKPAPSPFDISWPGGGRLSP